MPKKTQKDPEKVAAAYKGLMPKTVESPRWRLVPEDYKKWARDIFIFLIPAILAALTVLQSGGTPKEAAIAFYTLFLMILTNLLQKLASEKTYIV